MQHQGKSECSLQRHQQLLQKAIPIHLYFKARDAMSPVVQRWRPVNAVDALLIHASSMGEGGYGSIFSRASN